jgi:exportin-T
MGPSATHLVPPLMNRMLTHFDSTELVDFMNFIGLLVHRLQVLLLLICFELPLIPTHRWICLIRSTYYLVH